MGNSSINLKSAVNGPGNEFRNHPYVNSGENNLENKYHDLINQVSKVTKQIDILKSDNKDLEEDLTKIKNKNIRRLYV